MDMDGPVVARVVRDPEVYITVSISDLRRGVAQWLAHIVRYPEVYITVSLSDLRPDVAQYLAYSFVTTRTEVYILSH